MKYLFLFFVFIVFNVNASEIKDLAKGLNLYPGNKASIQWERIFSSPRRLEKYGLYGLTKDTRDKLEIYLINHAADSEQPIVPGL